MMAILLGLALKSLLVAALTLVVLRLTRRRSAAERSLIAHLGLFALVALPFAGLALPSLPVPIAASVPLPVTAPKPMTASTVAPAVAPTSVAPVSAAMAPAPAGPSRDWTLYFYAAPAAGLLLLTAVALLRLFALSRGAEVLVEPRWLSALAHAQRRMGMKSGTALLVSDALPSPVSWGWARPVILLNRAALDATDEAEAIIAHELAHVVSLDWAKLMLARVATALFWFNPLAWVLTREAHQLREEAADDAVLATAIPGLDYAELLVGVARHEAKGLLLGAHGVASGKGGLRRRVSRVLDGSLARQPAGRGWIAGFATGMLVMAAPLAALTLTPKTAAAAADPASGFTATAGSAPAPRGPAGAMAPLADAAPPAGANRLARDGGMAIERAIAADGDDDDDDDDDLQDGMNAIDAAVAMKATGVTPDYRAAIEAAAPSLGPVSAHDAVAMKSVGVTPAYVRDLAAAGLKPSRPEEIISARAIGVTGDYARAMASRGYRGSIGKLVEMRALGLTPDEVARHHRAGTEGAGRAPPD